LTDLEQDLWHHRNLRIGMIWGGVSLCIEIFVCRGSFVFAMKSDRELAVYALRAFFLPAIVYVLFLPYIIRSNKVFLASTERAKRLGLMAKDCHLGVLRRWS